jgi:Ni/Co efflux regulator RcnB
MRKLLLSTAALFLLAAPVLADPPSDRGGNRGEHSNRAGKASVAPQVHDRAPAQLRVQPQQIQRQDNSRGRGNERHEDNRVRGNPPAPPARSAVLENRGNRDNGDRFRSRNDRDRTDRRRDNRVDDRNDSGRMSDRDRRLQESRPDMNRDLNRDLNRDGRTDYRQPNFDGPRHDFSSFRDYHRNFHVSRRFQAPAYRRPAGWYEHRWGFGELLPAAFWARDYWLVDFAEYDLPPPPYGAVWVRVGGDALLIDEDSGEIITVAYDVFY